MYNTPHKKTILGGIWFASCKKQDCLHVLFGTIRLSNTLKICFNCLKSCLINVIAKA